MGVGSALHLTRRYRVALDMPRICAASFMRTIFSIFVLRLGLRYPRLHFLKIHSTARQKNFESLEFIFIQVNLSFAVGVAYIMPRLE